MQGALKQRRGATFLDSRFTGMTVKQVNARPC
jgi:hypothetical protein